MKSFETVLREHKIALKRNDLKILQVNIGKRCNQACAHCHVDAGPTRTENMDKQTIDRLLMLLRKAPQIHTVDITGGAPELNPHFKYFVSEIRAMGKEVINRCNLTVLLEKGQEDTAQFLADNQVQIVASLPCYLEENVDKQRGKGVYEKSIRVLKMLNDLGYGKTDSDLVLNLVYNPGGPFLPPDQTALEADYHAHLQKDHGIVFTHLLTITNMPINRYEKQLERQGKLAEYMTLLTDHFNPEAARNVMCTELVSIGWNGQIYDCDFNQMLNIPTGEKETNVLDIDSFDELTHEIALANHCFGCAAGCGSSCGGALT